MAPIPPPPRRNWTVPVILGIVGLVLLLIICVAGTAAGVLAWRSARSPEPSVTTSALVTPSRSPESPAAPKTPAECLVGDWVETSFATTSEIYGTRVHLTSKGTLVRYTGTEVILVLQNIVVSGVSGGDSYEVIHNGTLKMNYVADDKTISYSNPQVSGTTTWKVNGKTRDSREMGSTLTPETYHCQGNDLRLFGDESASELKRVVPPGTPI